MEADENLLFGVVARQVEYIDSVQFTEACADWARRKDVPIPDILVDRGWITRAEKEVVQKLVRRKMQKRDGDIQQTLSEVADAGIRDSIREVDDASVRESLSRMGPARGYVQIETVDHQPEVRSRYTLTRVHGEGGVGRVWLAHDEQLNREVALKQLRPDKEIHQDNNRQFVKEAQVTGQLEHPNIVPVYELSRDAEDESFYTMRFLRGQTLREAIRKFHASQYTGREQRLELRRLLNDFVDICNAIAYAHSKGVVHRDLKPANVMLGAFGEVIVLDWGMAKLVDRAEEDADESKVTVTPAGATEQSHIGHVAGTPAYMAPEQAEGKRDLIDARTDIYGLGAILFAILTGEHPHKGPSTRALISGIVTGPSPRARQLVPTVPRSLDAICAMAMAKKRAQRYRQVRNLADDVRRWLADESVSAYRETWSVRLARWMRRHRTWSQAIGAALVLVAVVSAAAMLVVDHARRSEQRAKDRAESALVAERAALAAQQQLRAEALQRFQEARATVDKSLTGVSTALQYFPGMQRLRQRLLEEAAADYRRFASQHSDDPELQAEAAKASIRLGDVHQLLGQHQDAQQSYRNALAVLEPLADQLTDMQDLAIYVAHARTRLGSSLSATGDLPEARSCFAGVLAKLDEVMPTVSDNTELRAAQAECQVALARAIVHAGETSEAIRLLRQAIDRFQSIAETHPTPQHLAALAATRSELGQLLDRQGDTAEAIVAIEAAIEAYDALLLQDRHQPDYVEARVVSLIHLANARHSLGQIHQERLTYQEAIDDLVALVTARPDVPHHRENLAITRTSLARLLHEVGSNQEARIRADKAIEQFAILLNNHLPLPRHWEGFAAAGITQGRILTDMDENESAAVQFRGALQIYQQELSSKHGDEPGYRTGIAVSRSNLARLLHKIGNHDEALTGFQAALEDFAAARQMQQHPDQDHYTLNAMAWTHSHLGDLLWTLERPDEARKSYGQVHEIREQLPKHPEYLRHHAWFLLHCHDPEMRDPQRAVELSRQSVKQAPDNEKYRCCLGAAYYRSGDWVACITALAELQNTPLGMDGFAQLYLSMAYWQAGDRERARATFQQAIASDYLVQNAGNPELVQLRGEAAELLNVTDQSPSDTNVGGTEASADE